MTPKLKEQIALFLTSIIFILAQFIAELVIIYGIIEFIPSFTVTLYASKQVIVVVHLLVTLFLVVWAKHISNDLYHAEA